MKLRMGLWLHPQGSGAPARAPSPQRDALFRAASVGEVVRILERAAHAGPSVVGVAATRIDALDRGGEAGREALRRCAALAAPLLRRGAFEPHSASHLLAAFARSSLHGDSAVRDAVAAAAAAPRSWLTGAVPGELARAAWAAAELQAAGAAAAVAAELRRRGLAQLSEPAECDHATLALWGLAVCGAADDAVEQAAEALAAAGLPECCPTAALARLAWAAARSEAPSAGFVALCTARACPPGAPGHHPTLVLWACASLSATGCASSGAAEAAVRRLLQDASAAPITAWALCRLRAVDRLPQVLDRCAATLAAAGTAAESRMVANAAWAAGAALVPAEGLMREAARYLGGSGAGAMQPQEIAALAWALAVSEHEDCGPAVAQLAEAAACGDLLLGSMRQDALAALMWAACAAGAVGQEAGAEESGTRAAAFVAAAAAAFAGAAAAGDTLQNLSNACWAVARCSVSSAPGAAAVLAAAGEAVRQRRRAAPWPAEGRDDQQLTVVVWAAAIAPPLPAVGTAVRAELVDCVVEAAERGLLARLPGAIAYKVAWSAVRLWSLDALGPRPAREPLQRLLPVVEHLLLSSDLDSLSAPELHRAAAALRSLAAAAGSGSVHRGLLKRISAGWVAAFHSSAGAPPVGWAPPLHGLPLPDAPPPVHHRIRLRRAADRVGHELAVRGAAERLAAHLADAGG